MHGGNQYQTFFYFTLGHRSGDFISYPDVIAPFSRIEGQILGKGFQIFYTSSELYRQVNQNTTHGEDYEIGENNEINEIL